MHQANKSASARSIILCMSLLMILTASAWAQKSESEITALGYTKLYQYNIGNTTNLTSGVTYTVDNSATAPRFIDSVAYQLTLGTTGNTNNYVFTSMDAFSSNAKKLGIPTFTSGAVFQQYVNNLYYETNSTNLGATEGSTLTVSSATGNIEFWPTNYSQVNSAGITGASTTDYDFGDNRITSGNTNNYGSMQVHDYLNSKTVFAFNHWNSGTASCVGIGNSSTSGSKDWTFADNAATYSTKTLEVYVKPLTFAATGEKLDTINSELASSEMIYRYDIPTNNTGATVTSIDNSASFGMPIARTSYYYELTKTDGSKDYVYTSFDSMTNNPSKTGLASNNNFSFFQKVDNMTVVSNVEGVVNGTNITTGNVEICSTNYHSANTNNIPNADGATWDFGDVKNGTGNSYGSFQIHNYGADLGNGKTGQTVLALNNYTSSNPDVGIGSNPNAGTTSGSTTLQPDWTWSANANTYSDAKLYVFAQAAIAPGMENVTGGSEYTVVQGAKLTSQMNTNIQTGMNYDIVNNLQTMKDSGVLFDRVGYYMEYANTSDDTLTYVFVSFDAMTSDLSKIGVPTYNTGITWNQTRVNNLEITTNVTADQGKLTTDGTTQATANTTYKANQGSLEFWSASYSANKGTSLVGSGNIWDTNDLIGASNGYGSMQIHNQDMGETIFALNGFDRTKTYGIGTNPNASTTSTATPQADWTFDTSKSGYQIANIYTFVHEVNALLTSDYQLFQRDGLGNATATIKGGWATNNGVEIATMRATLDGENYIDLTINSNGTYSSAPFTLSSGNYSYTVEAFDASGNKVATGTTGVGIGEIFITAGQSNSANHGDLRMYSTSGNAYMYNMTTDKWEVSTDAQPGATGSYGSTWSSFADELSEKLGVPVGTYAVGVGGSAISSWGEGTVNYKKLLAAFDELGDNFTGILWHQGETDNNNNTTEAAYEAMLRDLIARSREDSGKDDLMWGVAIASWNVTTSDENITNAQLAVINDDLLVFLGPDTDQMRIDNPAINGTNSNNTIHFSEVGLEAVGQSWAATAANMVTARDSAYVPEPSTWIMFILGLGTLAFIKRKNKNRN